MYLQYQCNDCKTIEEPSWTCTTIIDDQCNADQCPECKTQIQSKYGWSLRNNDPKWFECTGCDRKWWSHAKKFNQKCFNCSTTVAGKTKMCHYECKICELKWILGVNPTDPQQCNKCAKQVFPKYYWIAPSSMKEKRVYGVYKCPYTGVKWSSGYTFAYLITIPFINKELCRPLYKQDCKYCNASVYAHKCRRLRGSTLPESGRHHMKENCHKCRYLPKSCPQNNDDSDDDAQSPHIQN